MPIPGPSTILDSRLLEALPARRRTTLVRALRRGLSAAQAFSGQLIVGCSGGPDSTALLLGLAALREPLKLSLHVVAVDHGLRPAAVGEAQAVCALAQRLGLAAEVATVLVPAGPSRLAQARAARYRALAEAALRHGAQFIAVGHTRDDQAETVLMRLLGGAGLQGLSGMALCSKLPADFRPPSAHLQTLQLVRPLLSVARAEIESFLLPLLPLLPPLPFADPSNTDPRYLRSRLRGEALPLLRQLAPQLDQHLLFLAQQLRADAEHLEQEAEKIFAALSQKTPTGLITLPVAATDALPQALKARVLRQAASTLLGISLGQRHVEALISLCHGKVGGRSLNLPGGLRAERRRDILRLFLTDKPAC